MIQNKFKETNVEIRKTNGNKENDPKQHILENNIKPDNTKRKTSGRKLLAKQLEYTKELKKQP